MIAANRSVRGKGLGTLLLLDVFERCLAASKIAGGRFIVLDAINEEAAKFYRSMGFEPLVSQPSRMIISMAKIRRNAEEEARRSTALD